MKTMKIMKTMFLLVVIVAILAFAACSNGTTPDGNTETEEGSGTGSGSPGGAALGGGGVGTPLTPVISVTVSPTAVNVAPGGTWTFGAVVNNNTNQSVTWTVSGALSTISAGGVLSVDPSEGIGTTLTVTATSVADTTKSATATVTVSLVSSTVVTLTVTNPTRALTPIVATTPAYNEQSVTFSVTVGGLGGGDTVDIGLAANSYGLTLTGTTTGLGNGAATLTLSHDGSGYGMAMPAVVALTITAPPPPADYVLSGSPALSVNIYDGATVAQAIPLDTTNFTAFKEYAATTAGLAKHYKLIQNITAPGTSTAIGTSASPFEGSFDGDNYSIGTLALSGSYSGLFSYIGPNGVVKNVNLTVSSGSVDGNRGGVAGENRGLVEHCTVAGTVSTGGNYIGGVVGTNSGTVQYCSSTATTSNGNYIGGIAGSNRVGGTVQFCSFAGTIIANGSNAGGIVSYSLAGSKVENCFSTGTISSASVNAYAGGIAGELNASDATVKNCYSTISISASGVRVGGVVGSSIGSITACVALQSADITGGGTYLGRVVGYAFGTLSNNYADDNLTPFVAAGANLIDGADVNASVYNTQAFWEGLGWDFTTVWEMTGPLPTLR